MVSEIKETKIITKIGLYSQKVNAVANTIKYKQAKEISWQDTLDDIYTLELWRDTVGINTVLDDNY